VFEKMLRDLVVIFPKEGCIDICKLCFCHQSDANYSVEKYFALVIYSNNGNGKAPAYMFLITEALYTGNVSELI
jgi:hypothetical protein